MIIVINKNNNNNKSNNKRSDQQVILIEYKEESFQDPIIGNKETIIQLKKNKMI